jgi:hypothetical protein
VLDDDVQFHTQGPRVALDAYPLAAQDAPDPGAGGQADDAVAGEGGLGDDLGDRIPRDDQAPVLEVQAQLIRHSAELDRIGPDPVAFSARSSFVAASSALALGLIALFSSAPGHDGVLERLSPVTLQPSGRAVRAPDSSLGIAWARSGSTLALTAKAAATGQPIRIVDARTLRTRREISVGDRDVCGLTFDGHALVALTANQPCYWAKGRFDVIRYDTRTWRPRQTIAVPGLRTVFPTNLAFGDGKGFVARAGAGVDELDLRTGTLARHRPRRSLAKGEGIVLTRWLGDHELAVGAEVVDVRTWRARVLDPTARGVASAGGDLVPYGARGLAVFSRSGRLRYHLLPAADVSQVHVVGRYLYAADRLRAHVIDLRTGRELPTTAGADVVWSLLEP